MLDIMVDVWLSFLCTIFTQGHGFKVKITDLVFSYECKSVSLPYDKDDLTGFTDNCYADIVGISLV